MNLGFNTRYKYFAPRIGVAYRLNDKTVIRAGYGVSYTPFPDNNWMYNFPVRSNNLYAQPGGSTDTYGAAVLPNGQPASFEAGFPAPQPVFVPQNGRITPQPTSAETYVPTNYRNGYIEAWNFAVERQLPFNLVLDVAYVGSHGVDTPAAVDLNAGQILNGGSFGEIMYMKYGITSAVTQYFQGFSSTYNSLQVKFDRRFSKGFSLTTAFTWQKAMDFQSGDDGGLDFYAGQGLGRNYARASFDRTLNFIQSYIYQLPFGRGEHFLSHGFAGKLLGGWQLSGILSARTGTPLTFTGNSGLNLGRDGTATLEQVAPIQVLGGINAGNSWFSKSSFATTPTGVQGNTGRDIWSGPGLFSLDASLSRWVDLRADGSVRLQLRLESFNVTNTPEFSNPDTGYTANTFSYVTGTLGSGTGVNGTGGGRAIQLGAKVTF